MWMSFLDVIYVKLPVIRLVILTNIRPQANIDNYVTAKDIIYLKR